MTGFKQFQAKRKEKLRVLCEIELSKLVKKLVSSTVKRYWLGTDLSNYWLICMCMVNRLVFGYCFISQTYLYLY